MMDLDLPAACPACGTQLGASMLACPKCRRLVYADRLKELAQTATTAEENGDYAAARASWLAAQSMLPPDAAQYTAISGRIQQATAAQSAQPTGEAGQRRAIPKWLRWLGALAAPVLFLLTKAKFLLLGLAKLPTLLSMGAFLGVYWSAWGWKFALGFVICLYLHEMGHVFALRRYRIAATAPLFIPGFGAVVFSRQAIVSAKEDSRIGLAGPLYGLVAALGCYGIFALTGSHLFSALATFGAWVNLFNLFPFWFLDGSRGVRSLNRRQRWWLAALAGVAGVVLWSKFTMVIAAAIVVRMLFFAHKDTETKPDWPGFALFALLLLSLATLSQLPLPKLD